MCLWSRGLYVKKISSKWSVILWNLRTGTVLSMTSTTLAIVVCGRSASLSKTISGLDSKDGTGDQREDEPAGHRDPDASRAHQLQTGFGRAQRIFRIEPAVAIHGSNQSSVRNHP